MGTTTTYLSYGRVCLNCLKHRKRNSLRYQDKGALCNMNISITAEKLETHTLDLLYLIYIWSSRLKALFILFGGAWNLLYNFGQEQNPDFMQIRYLVCACQGAASNQVKYFASLTFIIFGLRFKSTVCSNKLNQQSQRTTTWGDRISINQIKLNLNLFCLLIKTQRLIISALNIKFRFLFN